MHACIRGGYYTEEGGRVEERGFGKQRVKGTLLDSVMLEGRSALLQRILHEKLSPQLNEQD